MLPFVVENSSRSVGFTDKNGLERDKLSMPTRVFHVDASDNGRLKDFRRLADNLGVLITECEYGNFRVASVIGGMAKRRPSKKDLRDAVPVFEERATAFLCRVTKTDQFWRLDELRKHSVVRETHKLLDIRPLGYSRPDDKAGCPKDASASVRRMVALNRSGKSEKRAIEERERRELLTQEQKTAIAVQERIEATAEVAIVATMGNIFDVPEMTANERDVARASIQEFLSHNGRMPTTFEELLG